MVAVGLLVAGLIVFFNAAEWEARDGSSNHRILWSSLSALVSVLVLFVAGWGVMAWLIAQAGLFVGIAAERVWLEARERG